MNEARHSREGQTRGLERVLNPLIVTLISVGMLLGGFLLSQLDTTEELGSPTRAIARGPTMTPFLPTFTPEPSPRVAATQITPTPMPPAETKIPVTPTLRPTQVAAALPPAKPVFQPIPFYVPPTPFYVPPTPFYVPPTPSTFKPNPPADWVKYIVQAGDTLYSLSRRFGVTVDELRQANGLHNNEIYVGQELFVPRHPTPWPTATPTTTHYPSVTPTPSTSPTSWPSLTPTGTQRPTSATPTTSVTPPATTTETPTSVSTVTSAPTPTLTSTPAATPTSIATTAPAPTPTELSSPTPLSTPTPTEPSATPVLSPTADG